MNEHELFEAVLKLPPADRVGFLDEACVDDTSLRDRIEALLARHAKADSIPERPVGAAGLTGLYQPITEGPGSIIGPYKLLQKIGEGGFGVVCMAEQERPVRRMVALKIIKPGMDSAQVIARFESERQALALMDHPNIAKVLDAGATNSGRPYFVMELVKGVPITEFCDKNHMDAEGRLKLFIDVCHAIQHAHHKGVIHRDIKPSNVMVTLHDGVPVVKVIDFGVAKATVQKLTEKTLFTAYGQIIGTPAYMSPEQAEMSGLDIDTRSDVYSLGVLLYELLTGTTPLENRRLRQASYGEMQRLIREETPPRPSNRLSSLGESATVLASNRGLDVKRLVQLLSGGLDWIVMKALEKNRNRRYGTPSNFAEDIERYLRQEGILARPPSTAYLLTMFVRRNRAAVITTAIVAAALLVGTTVATWQAIRATRAEAAAYDERNRTLREKERANEEAAIAQAVNDFLTDDLLGQANPDRNSREKPVTVEELLRRAETKIENNPRFAAQPRLEATLRLTIGKTYFSLSHLPEAERQLHRALDLRNQALGWENAETLTAAEALADFLNRGLGKFKESEPLAYRTWAGRQRLLGPEHADTLDSLDTYAQALNGLGQKDKAARAFRECRAARRHTLGPDHPDSLNASNNLAACLLDLGAWSEATPMLWETLKIREKKGKDREETLITKGNLGLALFMQGELVEAEELFQEALKLSLKRFGLDHRNTDRLRGFLTRVWLDQLRPEEALVLLQKVVSFRRGLYTTKHRLTGEALAGLGHSLVLLRRWDEARKALAESLQVFETAPPPNEYYIGWAECWYGVCLTELREYKEAEEQLLSATRKLSRSTMTPRRHSLQALEGLAHLYDVWGKPEEAKKWRNELAARKTP